MSPVIYLKYCLYCEKVFGCVINGISLNCTMCSAKHSDPECAIKLDLEMSHGFCSYKCCCKQYPNLNIPKIKIKPDYISPKLK
jgi:hypothetical protein